MLEQVPARGYLGLATVGLAISLVTTAAVVAAPDTYPPEDYELDPDLAVAIVDEPTVPTVANEATRDELADTSVQLVIQLAGTRYVVLAELDETTTPKHGKLRRAKDEFIEGVVASVPATEVPSWNGHDVRVDDRCVVTLHEFAIVSRLIGDPGYAGLDGTTWTNTTIFDQGHRVLVAKLDTCPNSSEAPVMVRDVAAPKLAVFEAVEDAAHAKEARERVLASQPAADIAAEWTRAKLPEPWTSSTELATMTVRDARTGTTWISVHGHSGGGCGDPDANIWGLFRVEVDGSLGTVQLRKMEVLTSIESLVDLDGDGVPELVGSSWLGPNVVVVDIDGNELAKQDVPFFGCPC